MNASRAFQKAIAHFGREGTAAVVAACIQTAGADMLHEADEIINPPDLAKHATEVFTEMVKALMPESEKAASDGNQKAMFEDA